MEKKMKVELLLTALIRVDRTMDKNKDKKTITIAWNWLKSKPLGANKLELEWR